MLVDKRIPAKIEAIEKRYDKLRFEKIADVEMEYSETLERLREEPGAKQDAEWKPAAKETKWGGEWWTAWFRGDVQLPVACADKKVYLRANTDNCETLLRVDGECRGAYDPNHPVAMLTRKGVARKKHHVSLEAYAGHTWSGLGPDDDNKPIERNARTFGGAELLLQRDDVTAFVFDLRVLRQTAEALGENSLRRNQILKGLERVYAEVDALPIETGEKSWRPKLAVARKIMSPLLNARNGSTAPRMALVGNSHIDTVWLWPLAETWRKCARTFSTVLSLMDQYADFNFIQSAPCHTDMLRREYPDVYDRIKKMVEAGRWEPNGAMWIEPDANLTSGESFVRQLLVGQAATREMFGYTSNMLWLPDVFGYSAALPQILLGCGVEFFCTQKMAWSDTTRFPFDTFHWQGIDGSSVLTHLFHDYCATPDVKTLHAHWDRIQHKDVQDRQLVAFGYGDGGGGPTMEMLETTKRLGDLEGCPRTETVCVGDYLKKLRDELGDLPTWVGELYLELHRGTLTSIAPIKRGNRKAELALRDAEYLSTLAAMRGMRYPVRRLLDLWKTLLTNQFHDILPGTSLAEANDQAIAALDGCVEAARELSEAAMRHLAGKTHRQPSCFLVANTLSWDRKDEIVLTNVPQGLAPWDERIRSQRILDVEDNELLVVDGLELPAMGAAVLDLAERESSDKSSFKIRGNRIETPHAVVRLNRSAQIVSLRDKASGRELVRPEAAFNAFELADDVPGYWDNWDLDADHVLKRRIENRLIEREVVADGPLQLRLRCSWRIGARSTLTQDIVFHATTPRIDFETTVAWAEKHTLLKALFPLNILADSARHEIQFGHVERPTHGNQLADRARFEVCAHKWTDVSENGFGVALLNDSKYGVSVRGAEIGLSLLRSGTHPDPRGDAGRHVFTYSLQPHQGGFSVQSVVRPAYEVNVPVVAVAAGTKAKGFAGLVAVDAPNVIVEAIKWAENGKAFVVRLYEAGKTGCQVAVRFQESVRSVSETNMLEENPKKLHMDGNLVCLAMRAFEIKTLYCQL